MPTFNITEKDITVTDDRGDTMTISADDVNFLDAVNAAMTADWAGFREISLESQPTTPKVNMGCMMVEADSIEDAVNQFSKLLDGGLFGTDGLLNGMLDDEDEELDPDDEPEWDEEPELNEHDLRNWNGSPIYYLTKEQAKDQVDGSCGFWAYHDFGIAAKPGRRYATVPNGFGPTAPEGYEWACVPKED